jgi:RNA polymerase sigma-70 factor (ECF subfamily)
MTQSSQVSELLIDWCNGDQAALERLVPLVERELRRLAHSYMRRESSGHLLQTTALVNEAFIRLLDQKSRWQNRAHFFGIAAQIMRRVLLNYARDQRRVKRGGGAFQVSLSEADAISAERSIELIALDDAMTRLAMIDERKSRIVELKYFGGLTSKEIAEVLEVGTATVDRDWKLAKAWLTREIVDGA